MSQPTVPHPSVPHPWPKLSEDLRGPSHPLRCRRCGGDEDLWRWREMDDEDEPTPVVVVLCRPCSGRIVGPHPRLYEGLHRHEPHAGTSPLCVGCGHRDGLRCAHPGSLANGGPGIKMAGPRAERTFVRYRHNRRLSGVLVDWQGPPTSCTGRLDLDVIPAPPPASRPACQGLLPLASDDPTLPPVRRTGGRR
jgi:hypothetical protein